MTDDDLEPTNCITAEETRQVYLRLVDMKLCGEQPCLRDECEYCGPLIKLIDARAEECEQRGCTLRRCVYDSGVPSMV